MRMMLLVLCGVLFLVSGCQSGQRIETRTHTFAPWQVAEIPAWEKAIQTTVAPEKWNEEASPHRISSNNNQLTIRTTKSNQETILKYLSSAAMAQ